MSGDDTKPMFDHDLPSLGVRGRWVPIAGERLLCSGIVRHLPRLVPAGGDQRRRWAALRATPVEAIAVLGDAPPEQVSRHPPTTIAT
jgi:hypothetical protein